MSSSAKIEFKAEIKKLLHILSQSLYQHKEIFLRELISNASDALKKMHFVSLQERENVENPDLPLEIEVIADAQANTITVRDTGVGMTKDEMVENLGTIAGSGTEKFLQNLMQTQEAQAKELDLDIIGRFGVGFYSVFMVADKVQVISKSYLKEEPASVWESTGDNEFTVEPAEKDLRGTDVIIYLKTEEKEFLTKWQIESIIKKYSYFVPFPIFVTEVKPPAAEGVEEAESEAEAGAEPEKEEEEEGEEDETAAATTRTPVNEVLPLWKRTAAEIADEDYKTFYHYISKRYDDYLHVINHKVEGQVQFSAIYYIPETRSQDLLQPDLEYGLALYSRNVMIMQNCKDVVPQWMRFVHGVVESEDFPLNVSRETIQSNRMILKIKDLVSKKFVTELQSIADTDPAKYLTIWKEYGIFLKEGVVTDAVHKDDLVKLLRFQTSKTAGDTLSNLDEYVQRAAADHPDQTEIYYLIGDNLQVMKISPHMGYYKQNDLEVILFTESIDNFLMMNVHNYKTTVGEGDDAREVTFTFMPVDTSAEGAKSKPKPAGAEGEESTAAEGGEEVPATAPPEDVQNFLTLVKNILGTKIMNAVASDRLYDCACRLAMPAGGMTSSMERAMRYWTQKTGGKEFQTPQKIFEFNVDHPMIRGLVDLYTQDPLNGKIRPVVEQLFENCLLGEGDLPDPTSMVSRVNQLLEMLVTGRTDVANPIECAVEAATPEPKGQVVDLSETEEAAEPKEPIKQDTSQTKKTSKPAKKKKVKKRAKKTK